MFQRFFTFCLNLSFRNCSDFVCGRHRGLLGHDMRNLHELIWPMTMRVRTIEACFMPNTCLGLTAQFRQGRDSFGRPGRKEARNRFVPHVTSRTVVVQQRPVCWRCKIRNGRNPFMETTRWTPWFPLPQPPLRRHHGITSSGPNGHRAASRRRPHRR